jgi:hypothetical protein
MSEKRKNQRERILALLLERGPQGATNVELNAIGFRFGARVHEIRKAGWDVETKQESESLFRFILKGRKAAQQLRLIA